MTSSPASRSVRLTVWAGLLLVHTFISTGFAAEPHALGLDEALTRAWEQSPAMQAARRELEQNEIAAAQAGVPFSSKWNLIGKVGPGSDGEAVGRGGLQGSGELIAGVSWNVSIDLTEGVPFAAITSDEEDASSDSIGLSLQLWPPARDDTDRLKRNQLRLQAELSQSVIETAQNDVGIEVTDLYHRLWLAHGRLDVLKEALHSAKQALTRTQTRQTRQHATQLEVLQAQSDLLEAQNTLLSQEDTVAELRRGLSGLIGLEWESVSLPPFSDRAFRLHERLPPLPSTDQAVESAKRTSHTLKIRRLDVEHARQVLRARRRAKGFSAELAGKSSVADREKPQWGVFLEAAYALGDGAAAALGIRSARFELEQAEATLAQVERDVVEQAQSALSDVKADRRNIALKEAVAATRRHEWDIAQEQIARGLITADELSLKRRAHTLAVFDRAEAMAQHWVDYLRLQSLTGGAMPWKEVEVSDAQ